MSRHLSSSARLAALLTAGMLASTACAAVGASRRPSSVSTRSTQGAEHGSQDFQPGFTSLLESLANDLFIDSRDLEIELNARHATAGACHLEVHVAVVIFITHDVGEQNEPIRLFDQTD